MLGREDCSGDWQQRRKAYEAEGFSDVLVTSDDLGGIRQAAIDQLIDSTILSPARLKAAVNPASQCTTTHCKPRGRCER